MEDIFHRVVYTKQDAELVKLISTIPNLSAYLDSRPNILVFADFFGTSLQFSTSALPSDGPYFPRGTEVINLNIKDGGVF